ncbi:MAG: N-6 DNA methylase, partial [Aureliella sp.]
QDIHKIVDVFTRQTVVPGYSRMVPLADIEKNDFNLNLPRYIDNQQTEDLQDIEGHLRGGIPARDIDALENYWSVCPGLKKALFKRNRPGYYDLRVDKSEIKSTIYEHPEFAEFIAGMNAHFQAWRKKAAKKLKELAVGCYPKEVIAELSESLLAHYQDQPLIDPYDIYQHLLDYWAETMQDDCYLIASDGWKAEPERIVEQDKKGKTKDKGWRCDLVPKPLVVAKYFSKEQAALDALAAELENVASQLAEIEEEHGGDEGLLAELEKVNKANVAARLKEIKSDPEAKAEADVLNQWLKLNGREADVKKLQKDVEAALDTKANGQYAKLTEAEVKSLVVDSKWLATLDASIHGEMDRISQQLTSRVKELAERYDSPLSEISELVSELEAKVSAHLGRMGFTWM